MISQERLKIEVMLLLSANRKSYMPGRLAQQRMTLSDLEWPFDASRAISAVAELVISYFVFSKYYISRKRNTASKEIRNKNAHVLCQAPWKSAHFYAFSPYSKQ